MIHKPTSSEIIGIIALLIILAAATLILAIRKPEAPATPPVPSAAEIDSAAASWQKAETLHADKGSEQADTSGKAKRKAKPKPASASPNKPSPSPLRSPNNLEP